MSLGNLFLTLFLSLLSLQLGLSMELSMVAWVGAGLSVLAGLRIISLERPTWGLMFVLIATGGFMGSQVLEDWALEGSWPQTNGLGAGIILTILVYLLWLFAAREKSSFQNPLDRDTQTILVFGLLILLLNSPPDIMVVMLFGVPVALNTVAGILLASLVLMSDRCEGMLRSRLLLLLPLYCLQTSPLSRELQ